MKKCKIENCNQCPHMDNVYYDYTRECGLLNKILSNDICDIYTEIYKDCPLEDYQEETKKCSVDHEKYKLGADASIKHGYYIDHRIQCPECKEYLEPERKEDE